jgi:hypothetical protein
MRVIIAGSRTISDAFLVHRAILESGFEITEVVSGGARGVDTTGEKCASRLGVPVARFPAQWDKFGPEAGPIRNKEMADYADALILVWDGKSRGSRNMLSIARRLNLPVYEKIVQDVHENTEPTQEPIALPGF